MAPKLLSFSSLIVFLTFNMVLFNLVTSCGHECCPCPKHKHPKPPKSPCPPPYNPPSPPYHPPSPPQPSPTPSPPSPGGKPRCPRDALKFGICANVLNGLLNITLGQPPKEPCCTLIQGLADVEAALCLCTALKGNILGLNLNLPISLSLLLNYCGKSVPYGFLCY